MADYADVVDERTVAVFSPDQPSTPKYVCVCIPTIGAVPVHWESIPPNNPIPPEFAARGIEVKNPPLPNCG